MDKIGNTKKATETRTVALISVSSRVPTKVATDRTAHRTAPMREKNPKNTGLVLRQLVRLGSYKISTRNTSGFLNHNDAGCPSLSLLCYLVDC